MWVIADLASSVFQRMDWLLNLQLSRSLQRTLPKKSDTLNWILAQSQLPNYGWTESADERAQFTLVASQNVLPCAGVLLPPLGASFQDTPAALIQNIEDKMIGLKLHRARLFLPLGMNAGEVTTHFRNPEISWSLLVPKGDEKWI